MEQTTGNLSDIVLQCNDISKEFDSFDNSGKNQVLSHIDLSVKKNEFLVLFGPGQCGKTTLLNILAGLELPTSGTVSDHQKPVTAPAPQRGVVYQRTALFPWLTVMGNVEFGPKMRGMGKKERREIANYYIDLVGLKGFEKSFPSQLSGGMKRKLMVCRALLTEPEILLLDEPTAGMDAFARRQMWNLLKKLNQQKLTILLTTHYMEEAETLCDRVGFMCGGRLEETDAPGHMIETLGRYAVDETSPDGLKSHYFHGKEEAIQYLSASEQETALRSTTLEDVFLETIGQQLECR